MCLRLFIGTVTGLFPVEQGNQRILTNDSTAGTTRDSLSGWLKARFPVNTAEDQMKAAVVALILDSKPEEAISLLSKWYKVSEPRLGVGVFEGKSKGVAAVYSPNTRKILAAKREFLYDPFVMIHEFYHHLRSRSGRHRGTEKQANRFALDFIASYQRLTSGLTIGKVA